MITCKIHRHQNKIVRGLLESNCATYKNWIVSAVERKEYARAEELTKELRLREELYHTFLPDDMVEDGEIYPRWVSGLDTPGDTIPEDFVHDVDEVLRLADHGAMSDAERAAVANVRSRFHL
jgi:hypothetical protein